MNWGVWYTSNSSYMGQSSGWTKRNSGITQQEAEEVASRLNKEGFDSAQTSGVPSTVSYRAECQDD